MLLIREYKGTRPPRSAQRPIPGIDMMPNKVKEQEAVRSIPPPPETEWPEGEPAPPPPNSPPPPLPSMRNSPTATPMRPHVHSACHDDDLIVLRKRMFNRALPTCTTQRRVPDADVVDDADAIARIPPPPETEWPEGEPIPAPPKNPPRPVPPMKNQTTPGSLTLTPLSHNSVPIDTQRIKRKRVLLPRTTQRAVSDTEAVDLYNLSDEVAMQRIAPPPEAEWPELEPIPAPPNCPPPPLSPLTMSGTLESPLPHDAMSTETRIPYDDNNSPVKRHCLFPAHTTQCPELDGKDIDMDEKSDGIDSVPPPPETEWPESEPDPDPPKSAPPPLPPTTKKNSLDVATSTTSPRGTVPPNVHASVYDNAPIIGKDKPVLDRVELIPPPPETEWPEGEPIPDPPEGEPPPLSTIVLETPTSTDGPPILRKLVLSSNTTQRPLLDAVTVDTDNDVHSIPPPPEIEWPEGEPIPFPPRGSPPPMTTTTLEDFEYDDYEASVTRSSIFDLDNPPVIEKQWHKRVLATRTTQQLAPTLCFSI